MIQRSPLSRTEPDLKRNNTHKGNTPQKRKTLLKEDIIRYEKTPPKWETKSDMNLLKQTKTEPKTREGEGRSCRISATPPYVARSGKNLKEDGDD